MESKDKKSADGRYTPESGIHQKKGLIIEHMDLILKKISDDFSGGHERLEFVERLKTLPRESQFEALAEFLMDVEFDEETKEIQLVYYV